MLFGKPGLSSFPAGLTFRGAAPLTVAASKGSNKHFFPQRGANKDIFGSAGNRAGKPHGEKTAEKIRKELFAALGVRVYITNKYDDAYITCYDLGRNAPFRQLEFCASRKAGENVPALIDNKVQALTPDCFRLYRCGGYVDDVPAQVAAIRAAHEKAREAEAAFSAAVSAYNSLTRGNIVRASTREGVKSWLI